MEITSFQKEYLPEASALFVQNFKQLRTKIPILPDRMESSQEVLGLLDRLFTRSPGVLALEQGRLAGFMGWFLVDHFRGTDRKGAYCPEWGHAAIEERKPEIYRAMYRSAAAEWAAAGCQVHAITLLAHDRSAEQTWFWNGFGLTVVDAVRPVGPLGRQPASGLQVRKACLEDVSTLTALDSEHWRHYRESPIFMPVREGTTVPEFTEFLSRPKNSVWLAMDGEVPAGFMRCEGYNFDGVEIVNAETTVSITGAYIRPAYRGHGMAAALLDAALRDYAKQGLRCCSVNFESFNPEATAFWMKYFESVCLSALRVPET